MTSVQTDAAPRLRELNEAPRPEAVAELLEICHARAWAERMADARPFADLAALQAAADSIWTALGPDAWLEALRGHPRIGESGGSSPAHSRREQAGMAGASEEVRAALADGNRRYEERFGHVFLIAAAGRTAPEILAALERRLGNTPDQEVREAAEEHRRITRLRVERSYGAAATNASEEPVRYDVNLSMIFTELPLLERPAAAAAEGFDAVEFWWPFDVAVPPDADVDRFASAIEDAGVQLVGLNFFAGDMPGGDRGLVSWPARSAEFRENVAVTVELGRRLGCRAFNALYGNRIDDASPQEQDELAAENLALACEAAAAADAVVLVEPGSGAPRYPLLTAADAVAVIDRVEHAHGVENLRLLFDVYHLTVNGDDVDAAIDAHAERVGHVQIADHPGRHEPGTGSIDIEGHLARLAAAGYRGHVGLEYKPSGESAASFDWLPRAERSRG
jgi:hydroxypyruvate isomerase